MGRGIECWRLYIVYQKYANLSLRSKFKSTFQLKTALFFIAATEPALRDDEGLRKKTLLPVVRFMNGPEYEIWLLAFVVLVLIAWLML